MDFWDQVHELPNPAFVADEIEWICYDCGNTDKFRTIYYEWAGDYDVECLECGSLHGGEEVLSYKENEDV